MNIDDPLPPRNQYQLCLRNLQEVAIVNIHQLASAYSKTGPSSVNTLPMFGPSIPTSGANDAYNKQILLSQAIVVDELTPDSEELVSRQQQTKMAAVYVSESGHDSSLKQFKAVQNDPLSSPEKALEISSQTRQAVSRSHGQSSLVNGAETIQSHHRKPVDLLSDSTSASGTKPREGSLTGSTLGVRLLESLGKSPGSLPKYLNSNIHNIFQQRLSIVKKASMAELPMSYFVLLDSKTQLAIYQSEVLSHTLYPKWSGLDLSSSIPVPESFILECYWRHDLKRDFKLISRTTVYLSQMRFLGGHESNFEPITEGFIIFRFGDYLYTPLLPEDHVYDTGYTGCKVESGRVKDSYNLNHLLRLIALQQEASRLSTSCVSLIEDAEQRLAQRSKIKSRHLKVALMESNIRKYDQQIVEQSQFIQSLQLRIHAARDILKQKRKHLRELKEANLEGHETFIRSRDGLALTKRELTYRGISVMRRQQELMGHLHAIFPITKIPIQGGSQYDYCIRGLRLPSATTERYDDEKIATALGYIAHFISILSYYFDLPLRYPVLLKSSRSMIVDPISVHFREKKSFPLYAKGSEKIRFEYAVFLLNKNIEQLMNFVGIPIRNLRHTLPNLVLLCDAIAAWKTEDDMERNTMSNSLSAQIKASVPEWLDVAYSHYSQEEPSLSGFEGVG